MVWFRKLGRNGEHRWAMLRNMVTQLIYHERIMTTTAKAKELRRGNFLSSTYLPTTLFIC